MSQNNKYKLELTWIGKNDERQPLEPAQVKSSVL